MGVGLLHLERMRESPSYLKYLERGEVERLDHKYMFKGFLGHQDWWNLVIWEEPQLHFPLPCNFNYQERKRNEKTHFIITEYPSRLQISLTMDPFKR